ncbi:MAG: hypothetical protein DRQ39_03995 [Gammaproteobacteria bacterium]|nr:MAG: hypothetical protein DRQ39_03995 [Gammaproteobacteria bacterium]
MFLQTNIVTAAEDRAAKQQGLDKACEMAREKKLVPMRKQLIEECMNKDREKKDIKECERLHGNYNGRPHGRAPLFYDLPECEQATEFQKSYRQAN